MNGCSGSRILVVLAMAAAMVASAAPVIADAEPINTKVFQPDLPAFDIASANVERLHTIDGSLIYRIEIELGSAYVIPFEKATLPGFVQYEIRTKSGTALGGGSFDVQGSRSAFEKGRITVLSALGGIELGPETEITFHASLVTEKSVADCETFCDRCGSLAEALCINGVSEFNCTCTDVTKSCSFKCNIAPH